MGRHLQPLGKTGRVGASFLVAALGLVCLAPLDAWAGSDCPGTTLQMIACLEQKYRGLDSKLNQLYKRVLEGLSSSAEDPLGSGQRRIKELFMNAQEKWVSFRDEECRARSGYFSEGSMEKLELMACRVEITKDRIKLLESWVELLER